MKLKKQHRECLLTRLEELLEKKELHDSIVLKREEEAKDGSNKNYNPDLDQWYDVDGYLLDLQIKTIKQALIDNEIDY